MQSITHTSIPTTMHLVRRSKVRGYGCGSDFRCRSNADRKYHLPTDLLRKGFTVNLGDGVTSSESAMGSDAAPARPLLSAAHDDDEDEDFAAVADGHSYRKPGLGGLVRSKYVVGCALFSAIGGLIFGYGSCFVCVADEQTRVLCRQFL